MDVWERFKRDANVASAPSYNLILVGDRSAGKSTLISRFIDQNSSLKPTVGLGQGCHASQFILHTRVVRD